jgi:hypothetical protein
MTATFSGMCCGIAALLLSTSFSAAGRTGEATPAGAQTLLSFSSDAGAGFAAPVRLDAGDPRGRVSVALSDDNTAWISWVERTGGAASELRIRRVTRGGGMSPMFGVSSPQGTHTPGFPRMVIRSGEMFLGRTSAAQPGIPATIRMARARLSAR